MTKMLVASDSVGWTAPRWSVSVISWNFWIVAHHRPAGRMFQDSPQIAHAVCPLGIRETARGEHARNLPVELGTVSDDDNGRLLLGSVTPELECKP